jgi:hypothetical protein
MRKPAMYMSALAVVLSVLSVQAQVTPPTPPTQDQIQKMIDAKAYRPALQAIAQIMPAALAGDKYALLMMRGECLLQLKDGPTAIIVFDQAATAAGSLQQNEAARATAILIRKSPGLVYTSHTGDNRAPLDLTNIDARKRAMVALVTDELPAVAAQAGQALTARSLPPILAVAPTLRDLHALEQAGTGDDKVTIALVQPLADRIYALIDAELNRVNQQVQAIQRAAGRTVDYGSGSFQMVDGVVQQIPSQWSSGLSGENRQALREAVAYLGAIGQTCEDLTAVARRYERDGWRWQTLAKQTRGIMDFATAVYDRE